MWRDIGLDEWLFEIDDSTGEQIAERVVSMHRDPAGTRNTVERARETALARDRRMIDTLAAQL
jgi:hypothetical protein